MYGDFKRCVACRSAFCESTLPTDLLPDKCPKHMTAEETETWLASLPVQYNRKSLADAEKE
jgi:hypothetical protein